MLRWVLLMFAVATMVGVAGCSSDDGAPVAEGLDFTLQMEPRTVGPTDDRVRVRAPGRRYPATITVSDNRRDDDPNPDTLALRRQCRGGGYVLFIEGPDGDESGQAKTGAGCDFRVFFDQQGKHAVWLEVDAGDGSLVAASERKDVVVRDFLIVSIGDSVASGEGNPDQGRLRTLFGDETVWQDRQCHRSFRAGPAQAALDIEGIDDATTVTFVHLACSGARITIGLLEEYRGIERGEPLPPQLTQLQRLLEDPSIGGDPTAPREIDALIVTVGANDLRFGTIVQRCLLNDEDDGSCQAAAFRGEETVQQAVDRLLRNLPGRFERLAGCLGDGPCGDPRLGIAPERVLITEYFDPTQSAAGRFCRHPVVPLPRFNLTREEAQWAKFNVVDPLNERVAAAAAAHGWTLVEGLPEDFTTHGICRRPSKRWVLRLRRSLTRQLGIAGAFHPNRKGHSCYRNRLSQALAQTLGDELQGELPKRSSCV